MLDTNLPQHLDCDRMHIAGRAGASAMRLPLLGQAGVDNRLRYLRAAGITRAQNSTFGLTIIFSVIEAFASGFRKNPALFVKWSATKALHPPINNSKILVGYHRGVTLQGKRGKQSINNL